MDKETEDTGGKAICHAQQQPSLFPEEGKLMPGVVGAVAEFSPAIRFISLDISYSPAQTRRTLSSSTKLYIQKRVTELRAQKDTWNCVLPGQAGGKGRGWWSSGESGAMRVRDPCSNMGISTWSHMTAIL